MAYLAASVTKKCNFLILDHNEESLAVDASPSLPNTPHVPRFFVMHRNGTGYELLRHQDVSEFLKKAEEDAATAILKTPVEGLPGVTGITVLKPFPGNTAVVVVWVNKTNSACMYWCFLVSRN